MSETEKIPESLRDAPQWIKDVVAPISEKQGHEIRLHEIDMRVGAKLAEREILRNEYVRGILDCFTVVLFIAAMVYMTFFFGEEN
jgi:hypothetical protein